MIKLITQSSYNSYLKCIALARHPDTTKFFTFRHWSSESKNSFEIGRNRNNPRPQNRPARPLLLGGLLGLREVGHGDARLAGNAVIVSGVVVGVG